MYRIVGTRFNFDADIELEFTSDEIRNSETAYEFYEIILSTRTFHLLRLEERIDDGWVTISE